MKFKVGDHITTVSITDNKIERGVITNVSGGRYAIKWDRNEYEVSKLVDLIERKCQLDVEYYRNKTLRNLLG